MLRDFKNITHRPKGGMCATCKKIAQRCDHLQFEEMKPIGADHDGTVIVKCDGYVKKVGT